MKALVNYDKFNTSYESAVIPIDEDRQVVIKADVKSEDVYEDGEVVDTIETKVLTISFEDAAMSNKIELALDSEDFQSFTKLIQMFARNHLKVSL